MTRLEFCCDRFKESVEEDKFKRAEDFDETEWYMREWLHIYFCPFCGASVKGRGFRGDSTRQQSPEDNCDDQPAAPAVSAVAPPLAP